MRLKAEDIERLLAGCKKNDRKAQEQLYRAFHHVMMVICLRYSRDQQDAGTILNQGFLKIFLKIDQYDATRSALTTWMQKIMVNTAIDFLRTQSRFQPVDISAMQEETALESEVILKMNAEALLEQIRQMPPTTQLVFNLYAVDGYSHREIAQRLGIGEGTSRWHVNQARKLLRKSIMIRQ